MPDIYSMVMPYFWYSLSAAIVIILAIKSIIVVGGTEIAVVERRWFGKNMQQGRVIALEQEIGIQARTLGPGLHFLIPFLYAARKLPFTTIAEDEVGILESIDGDPVPPGKIFAKVVTGHNSFQDGESFLKNGGQKGPQIEILPPGTYRINPVLFKIRKESVISVDKGKIGLVSSVDGEPIVSGPAAREKGRRPRQLRERRSFPEQQGPERSADRHSAAGHLPGEH